jgi:hypothetical protein
MKRSLIVMALVVMAVVVLSAGVTLAAPGDPRIVQGTLEWPATVTTEPWRGLRHGHRAVPGDSSVSIRLNHRKL